MQKCMSLEILGCPKRHAFPPDSRFKTPFPSTSWKQLNVLAKNYNLFIHFPFPVSPPVFFFPMFPNFHWLQLLGYSCQLEFCFLSGQPWHLLWWPFRFQISPIHLSKSGQLGMGMWSFNNRLLQHVGFIGFLVATGDWNQCFFFKQMIFRWGPVKDERKGVENTCVELDGRWRISPKSLGKGCTKALTERRSEGTIKSFNEAKADRIQGWDCSVLLRTSDDIQPFPTLSRDVPLYPHPTAVTKIIAFVVQDP